MSRHAKDIRTSSLMRLARWAKSEPDAARDVMRHLDIIEVENARLRKDLSDARAVTPEYLRRRYLELYEFAAECQSYVSEYFQKKWSLTVKDLERFRL